MPSGTYEIEDDPFYITRGDDFVLTVEFNGEDVTGNTYNAQVREEPTSTEFIPFVVDNSLAATGFIKIGLSSATTRAMALDRYVFDFQEVSPLGLVETIFRAEIRMQEDVTR